MAYYGILHSVTNTGLDSEIRVPFSTPLAVNSNQPVFTSDTASLRRIVVSQRVQRWEIEAAMVPTNNSAEFLVHSVLNGYSEVFYVRMPQVYRDASLKTPAGRTLTLTSSAAINATTVNISGLSAGEEMALGEFITFSGDTKVYIVTHTGSNGSGVGIFPALRAGRTSGTGIKYGDKVTMQGRYDSNTQLGIKYIDGVLSDPGTVKIIEAI